MKAFLICIRQKPYKIVLLQALRVVFLLDEATRGAGIPKKNRHFVCPSMTGLRNLHALLQPLGLSVFFIAFSIAFGIVIIRKIDNDLPLSISIDCPFRPSVVNVRGAQISALFVIIRSIIVSAEKPLKILYFCFFKPLNSLLLLAPYKSFGVRKQQQAIELLEKAK